ncbi:tetratricopeptide repeat protein [bacterium]|nr:tetratricopeptide repeat protein [bacterium]MBP9808902.1 tetratricopeptide repeat protein [bacterium]
MRPYFHNFLGLGNCHDLLVASAFLLSLSACSSKVEPPTGRFGKLEQKSHVAAESQLMSPGTSADSASASQQFDMAAETVISDGCLHAWRKACAGDEKAAMSELEALDKRYPQILTIQFMMGQVLSHFGKTEEAIVHYRKASIGNEFSSLHSFKLAEAYRKVGKDAEAVPLYRKLLKTAPDFLEVKLGLAQSLLKSGKGAKEAKEEAQKLLAEVLAAKPDNAEALKLRAELAGPDTTTK